MVKVTKHGAIGLRTLAAALLALVVSPIATSALTLPTLRDLADPVAPGGILLYRIGLSDAGTTGFSTPVCFNPPPDCANFPTTCEGGVCNGGFGTPCSVPDGTLTSECPGGTFLCKRAFNENFYCGVTETVSPRCIGSPDQGFFCANSANDGTPCGTDEPNSDVCQQSTLTQPRPEPSYCLQNPPSAGICSGGPNIGQPCTAPHGTQTPECPDFAADPTPDTITVRLPILAGMSFIDADNGGTSDGTQVTWVVPPLSSCGQPGTPTCPRLNARLLIDALVPEGTVYANQATATDPGGFLVSGTHRTLIARVVLRALTLGYPETVGRDRFAYRSQFSLTAAEDINPDTEEFRINVSNADGTIVEFVLAPGQVGLTGVNTWTYSSTLPGLKAVRLRKLAEGAYTIRLRAAQLGLPDLTDLNVTVTLNLGDVTITHPARLVVKRDGKRYIAARSTSTTTLVTPPTTTTSTFGTTTTTTTSTTSTTETSTTSTTSTTVLPCGGLAPACLGSCDIGFTCTGNIGEACTCVPDTTTTSTTSTTSTTLLPCGGLAPACLGSCDIGFTCTGSIGEVCTCVADSTTTTSTTETSTTSTTSTSETSTSSSTSTSETSTSTSTTDTSTSSSSTSTSETSTSTSTTETSTTSTTSTSETSTSSSSTSTSETSTSTSTTDTSTSSSSTSTSETSTSTSTTDTSTSSSSTSTSETSTSSSSTSTSSTTSTTAPIPCTGIAPACLGPCDGGLTCMPDPTDPFNLACSCQ